VRGPVGLVDLDAVTGPDGLLRAEGHEVQGASRIRVAVSVARGTMTW